MLLLREGKGGRHFAGCSEWSGDDEEACGYTAPVCGACGKGLLAVAEDGRAATCTAAGCGSTVPCCRCAIPKPMEVRRNRRDMRRFWGCADYGRDGACGATIAID